jgi:hypothetical protein
MMRTGLIRVAIWAIMLLAYAIGITGIRKLYAAPTDSWGAPTNRSAPTERADRTDH